MTQWFERLANVPGINYQSSPNIDRTMLPGYNFVPSESNLDSHSLSWPCFSGGKTSASPAAQYIKDQRETSPDVVLLNLYEMLELPGIMSDYHFGIQSSLDRLWSFRLKKPEFYAYIEWFYWLNIRLLQAYPSMFNDIFDDYFPRISAFHRLIVLYESQGLLQKALEVAKISIQFEQNPKDYERLCNKILKEHDEYNG